MIDIPLMQNNISQDDVEQLKSFLDSTNIFTQSKQVELFECEWSDWLGVEYSVFVNSGSSANLITMAALRHLYGPGEVIVPALTWSSDISSILYSGLKPVFVDIDKRNLASNEEQIYAAITSSTRAVFLTHVLGFNGLSDGLLNDLKKRKIILIEDVCESHGASHKGKKLGSLGFASNFSFYYAHHMTTIEGGMISTSDKEFYHVVRMLRSHGLVRESRSDEVVSDYCKEYSDLNPEFIFAYPGFNVRSTELNAVVGRNQLKRLNLNNEKRIENCLLFYKNLSSDYYWTDFDFEGSVNYAFVVVLNQEFSARIAELEQAFRENKIEFRRGTSGGGNQLRQPYLKKIFGLEKYKNYPVTDYIHFNGFYIGNYPTLEREKILELCRLLNNVFKD